MHLIDGGLDSAPFAEVRQLEPGPALNIGDWPATCGDQAEGTDHRADAREFDCYQGSHAQADDDQLSGVYRAREFDHIIRQLTHRDYRVTAGAITIASQVW